MPTETVFNDNAIDLDFRVESSSLANMFHVDGGEDKIFIGHGATHSYDAYGVEIMMQLEAAGTAPYAGFGMIQNSNDADPAPLIFGKSRGTALASTTIVQDDDTLGRIEFQGMDGTDLETGCSIKGMVDGTPGANDMPGRLVFLTTPDGGNSATERMRISSAGHVYFITSGNEPSSSQTGVRVTGINGQNFWISSNSGTSGYNQFAFHNANGNVGNITTSGSGTSFGTSSDYRLKENVVYDWDATTRLKQLKPARFNFIADADTTVDGFLAHEAQAIVPECVTGAKDEVKVWQNGEELPDGVSVGDNKLDTDGNTIPKMQGIDQSKLVPLLVKTILELEARITALEG
jgi:hypothetical protein